MFNTNQIVTHIDNCVKRILLNGGEEELLTSLYDMMGDIKKVLDSSTPQELDAYCNQYDGFFHVMKLLEALAGGIADGDITIPD